MASKKRIAVVPVERITKSILVLRGQRVLLDSELAALYGVTTARLNQQVRRNLERFPMDFMFRLNSNEYVSLMLQNATSKRGRGGRRKLPVVFTEHGAIQAANVLNSAQAIEMGIYVVRAFARLRDLIASNKELAKRVDELESRLTKKLTAHDQAITEIIKTIRQLMNPPEPKKRSIGFVELQENKR